MVACRDKDAVMRIAIGGLHGRHQAGIHGRLELETTNRRRSERKNAAKSVAELYLSRPWSGCHNIELHSFSAPRDSAVFLEFCRAYQIGQVNRFGENAPSESDFLPPAGRAGQEVDPTKPQESCGFQASRTCRRLGSQKAGGVRGGIRTHGPRIRNHVAGERTESARRAADTSQSNGHRRMMGTSVSCPRNHLDLHS
jgi:hypothetical protein